MSNVDYYEDRDCPVFNRTIDCDLCYECVLALSHQVKISSVPELKELINIEESRIICGNCKYSNENYF